MHRNGLEIFLRRTQYRLDHEITPHLGRGFEIELLGLEVPLVVKVPIQHSSAFHHESDLIHEINATLFQF